MEVASRIIFASYLRNKVSVSATVSRCCATHPIEVEDFGSDSEVAPTSSGDSMIVRARFNLPRVSATVLRSAFVSLSSASVLPRNEDTLVVNFAVVALISLTGAPEGGVVGEPTATTGANGLRSRSRLTMASWWQLQSLPHLDPLRSLIQLVLVFSILILRVEKLAMLRTLVRFN